MPYNNFEEYKKDNPDKNERDYEYYCGEQFWLETEALLKKHAERNVEFLNSTGHDDMYLWIQDWMKNKHPKSAAREDYGNQKFDALTLVGGVYNTLAIELSKDELDKDRILYYLLKIKLELKPVLETI